jgi:hypothetical protein
MFIPDLDFIPSQIPDPGSLIPDPRSNQNQRKEKIK